MLTRRFAAAILVPLALAACANNVSPSASSAPSSSAPVSSAPFSSAPTGKPSSGGGETITGKVTAGVEPNCLLLQDSTGSHLLIFDDPALRSATPVGAQVTLVGESRPKMMSTCQQGIPFIVSSVG